ncbi:hypothetical protein D3C76_331590 [compost metagenome]
MIKLFRLLKPYRLLVAAVLVLVFFQTLSELYLPTLMSDIVDTGVIKGDTPYIWRVGLFITDRCSIRYGLLNCCELFLSKSRVGLRQNASWQSVQSRIQLFA